jgi:anti-anti-sigma factor
VVPLALCDNLQYPESATPHRPEKVVPMPATAAEPVLTLEVQHCPDQIVVVRCHGRLIAGSTDVLTNAVHELIPGNKRIILNLAELKHTDSMGLGALVRLYVSAKSGGSSLELMHLSKQIQHLLGLTNMFSIFTIIGENGIRMM